MDALKAARRQHRRFFTKACNEFDTNENNLTSADKIMKLTMIEEKAKLMIDVEYKIREILYSDQADEEIIDKDMDESEIYIDRWRVLQQRLNELLVVKNEDLKSDISVNNKNVLLHYPKIQLPTFNGEIKNWLQFWGQFQKIDQDTSLDFHDKFAYLSQAMEKGSVAEELIKSFPPGGNSYTKAVSQLKCRFGREELLIEYYVRDLLGLVLQKQNSGKHNSLRRLYDSLESKLRALETLGVIRDKYAAMLYPLVESSLPDDILRVWERYRTSHRRWSNRCNDMESKLNENPDTDLKNDVVIGSKTDLDNLLEFLQDEVEAEERISLASKSFDKPFRYRATRNNHEFEESQISTASDLLNSDKRKYARDKNNFNQELCIFCDKRHASEKCFKAMSMSYDVKKDIMQKKGACFACLKLNHLARNCRAKVKCFVCRKSHETLVCPKVPEKLSKPEIPEVNSLEKEDNLLASQASKITGAVLLQTLVVRLKNQNKEVNVRAIIDTGSEKTYITEDVIKTLGYSSSSKVKLIHKLFGGVEMKQKLHHQYKVKVISVDNKYECQLVCLDQNVICSNIRKVPNGHWIDELRQHGITISDLEDNTLNVASEIKLLIGSDVAGKLMTGNQKILSNGLVAMETLLGWCLMGKIPEDVNHESIAMTVTSLLLENMKIEDLWNLDVLGITDPSEKKTAIELQEAAKQHFFDTVKVENDRFLVHMPWIECHPPLPDNFKLCLKRLNKVVNHLKTEQLYESYGNVFKDWLRETIIELVPENELKLPAHYLPHRPVIKENSTTRIRPVFDASANQKGSPSLNDCLESGINLIEMIPTILYRFRVERIGVIADIRKAFLQISISPADKNYLRFLWFGEDGELNHYRHCRVVFGVTCSPFLLGIVIQYHLQNVLKRQNDEYPENMVKLLMNSFYVDNCVASVRNEEELELFTKVATTVMAERKFELRGWEYTNLTDETRPDTNVLGILWNKEADTLGINVARLKELCFEKVTKKIILSAAHRMFDPIGVACPVSLFPKLLLQRLWSMKLNWDEEVDLVSQTEFLKWLKNISHLENVRIPRYLRSGNISEKCSLHFFSDASKYAYAAVVFIRVESAESVKVQLLQARSRVSPTGKKVTTIARLELLAATISSRLAPTILHEIPHEEIYFWTDSTTVLTWIKRDESWGTFVNNRVLEIRSLTSKECWRHVPGNLNPADLPSRGCSSHQLLKSKWWEGPEWLYLPYDRWPSTEFIADEDEVLKEKRKGVVSSSDTVLIFNGKNVEADWYYRYYSQYEKIVKLIGWILRFSKNCRTSKQLRKKGNLDSEEFVEAEKKILIMIQKETFINEKDMKLKTLEVFKDQDGIIRLKTKIVYREDCDDFRKPAILPSHHEVVRRLIFFYHARNSHAGTQILLSILRERFWILNGRKTVRSVVSKCTKCKRYSGKNLDAVTAPLPEDRVRDAAVFEITGVDLAGPLFLKGQQKTWVCIFTCAVYRAVHLELVSAISTDAFLLALRRFIARRGRCSVIYCDNGTNFVGAANLLQSLDWNRIIEYSAVNRIQWKFNPPTASWWGGWWERLIRIMKDLLRRVLGRAYLSYEEMITVLCDCESVMNSRPLTYISERDSDLIPLTPSLFMQDIKESGVPDCDAVDHNRLNKRVKYRLAVQRDLRKRFRSEYLGTLIQKPKFKKWSTIAVGDIVLIGSDNRKRIDWPLGRVIELIPGNEGIVRLVKLQTARGELMRPIQRLYPLELTNSAVDNVQTQVFKNCSSNTKVSQECETPVQPTKEIRKTRHGRIIKVPERLDL